MKLWIGFIIIEILLLICTYTDIKYGKILNVLTLPAMGFGIVYHLIFHAFGREDGIGMIFSVLVILFMSYWNLIGGMGDAKLFIVLFLFLRPNACWILVFLSCLLFMGSSFLRNRKEFWASILNFSMAVYQRDITFLHYGRKRPFAPYVCVAYQLLFVCFIWKGGNIFG